MFKGNVKASLLEDDQVYAEILPNEQIELEFTAPAQTAEQRTFIIIVNGHYFTITN